MAVIKLRLAARCEAAGRPENEDNYQVSENLSEGKWGFVTDKEVELSEFGTLLVVADGMGGTNAGEIASAITIETVKEWFSADNLSKESFSDSSDIKLYIKKAIQTADRRIKDKGATNDEMQGMGSTIVLAWIRGKSVYVGWCGDSRCYRFNTADGLRQLSHDHSYVQELVDKGKIKPDEAFDFPDRNIITRSLGDLYRKAHPDVMEYSLSNSDILLLCSDGLSGVLRNNEMEEIIRENTDSMKACRDALWQTSYEAEWEDNVTLVLCQIISGIEEEKMHKTLEIENKEKEASAKEKIEPEVVREKQEKESETTKTNLIHKIKKWLFS